MKNVIFLVAVVMAAIASARDKAVVCVEKFTANEGCKIDGNGMQVLCDRISANLTSSRKYEVVERDELPKVQKELQLVDSGMTEGDAPESNRLKAAGYCIYGKVVQCRNFERVAQVGDLSVRNVYGIVELAIKITNITTGRKLADKIIKVEKSKTVSNAIKSTVDLELEVMTEAMAVAAKDVVAKLNDVAFPVYVLSANSRFVTANIAEEQVTIGDVWEVFVLGDELKDPQTGEVLGCDEELIASVRVSRPGPKTSKFEYGDSDATAEKCKKGILAANEDGEKMLMRKRPESAPSNGRRPSAPARGLRGLR